MAFCKQCGTQIPDGAAFCPNCGTPAVFQDQPQAPQEQYAAPQQQAQMQQYAAPQEQNYQQPYDANQQGYQQQYAGAQQGYQQPYNGAQQVYVTPEMDIQQNRGIAWLAYLGLLLLIPLFARKKSDYCRFHVGQGAILLAVNIVYLLTTQIFLAIIDVISPGYYAFYYSVYVHSTLYNVFNVLLNLGYIGFTVFAIIGIINAATGKRKELPLFGKLTFIPKLIDKIYAAMNK